MSSDLGWPVRRGAERIRGAGPNDVVVVSGTGSHAAHWNGATWVALPGLAALDPGATFFTMGLAVTPETVALAGLSDATGQAIIYRGTR